MDRAGDQREDDERGERDEIDEQRDDDERMRTPSSAMSGTMIRIASQIGTRRTAAPPRIRPWLGAVGGGGDDAPMARSRSSRFEVDGASETTRPVSDRRGTPRASFDPPPPPSTTSRSSSQAVPGASSPPPPSSDRARARPSASRVRSTAVASAR